ncbi:hypothetical protein DINM_001922 [Dirofilaria immitis]|nr:hypothetical protein [Dirofilaria immitis]
MVLAVACSRAVLIWRLDKQNLNVRPSANCADVITMSSLAPIIQCFWDSVFDQVLFVISASSSCLQRTSWFVGWQSYSSCMDFPDGDKIAVAYDGNIISVYDRHSWHEERWKKLKGVCMAAAWTSLSDVLSYGSEVAVPVYDLSEMVLEQHLGSNRGNSSSSTCNINGYIRDMKISPDGQRVAVTFNANPAIIALFVVETMPSFFLLLVWSTGKMQYIPLLYGYLASEGVHLNRIKIEKLVDEISSEQLLIRESQLSERTISRNNAQAQEMELSSNCSYSEENNKNSAATSSVNIELFSSMGLYDLLALKNAEKAN